MARFLLDSADFLWEKMEAINLDLKEENVILFKYVSEESSKTINEKFHDLYYLK